MILVDTSVVIEWLRLPETQLTFLAQLMAGREDLAISFISVTELFAGKSVWEKEAVRERLELVLNRMKIVEINLPMCRVAGKLRAVLGIGLPDALIAATALGEKMILATLNPKDFEKVKGLNLFC